MPDTRPGIKFTDDGICMPCQNYERQKTTNWNQRKNELENLCFKYRGVYGNSYDCAIAVSGGKDSHFQVWYMKEVMDMNPVLLTIGNIDWTETGRKNLANLSDRFSCDIIMLMPNHNVARKLAVAAFKEIGSPTWYADALIYAYPYRMTMKLGLHLLVYGEDVNYTYGGEFDEEKPSAMYQRDNDVVKPTWDKWFELTGITSKELESAKQPSIKECKDHGLVPIYLSYFTGWDSSRNYKVAKRNGFRTLIHEYIREGTIEQYNQVDSIGYLLNQYLKYPKFGHASATEMASRWIRSGLTTREEMIPLVKKYDKNLDQGIVDVFLSFTDLRPKEFWEIMDSWYNPDLFYQDKWGIWHEKFEVGKGMILVG